MSNKLDGWTEIGFLPFKKMAEPFNPNMNYMQVLVGLLAFQRQLSAYLNLSYTEQCNQGDVMNNFMESYGHYELSQQMMITAFCHKILSDWDRVFSKTVIIAKDLDYPLEVRRDVDLNSKDWVTTGSRAPDLENLWCREDGFISKWLPLYMPSGSVMVIKQVSDPEGTYLVGKTFVRK